MVIPRHDTELEFSIPPQELWIPSRDQLQEDEGFGPYRDTWIIGRVSASEATETVRIERDAVACVDQLSTDATSFDTYAKAIETADTDLLDDAELPRSLDCLEFYLDPEFRPFEGLDLGVAGLVHALASVGCYPAVSCRGHPGAMAWSSRPTVQFAARRWRALALAEIAKECRCSLVYDHGLKLLVAWAGSIEDTMSFGGSIIKERAKFRRNPKTPPRRARDLSRQERFDI